MEDNKIECPVCKQVECFKESVELQDSTIDSYLCLGCGYTTTSKNIDESIDVRTWEQSMPEIIKNSKVVTADKLAWYPSVLNFPSKGIIFPDGTNEHTWVWTAAKVVPVSEADAEKYPIPNKPGHFYGTRLDMENKVTFKKNDFKSACLHIGILEEK